VKAKKSESQLCFHKSPAKDGERWEVVGGKWQVASGGSVRQTEPKQRPSKKGAAEMRKQEKHRQPAK